MITLSPGSLCDVCAEEYGPHNLPHSIPCGESPPRSFFVVAQNLLIVAHAPQDMYCVSAAAITSSKKPHLVYRLPVLSVAFSLLAMPYASSGSTMAVVGRLLAPPGRRTSRPFLLTPAKTTYCCSTPVL